MFTTFHDRTSSRISSIVKDPLVAIWAIIAIVGVAFITVGVMHPSSSESAVARAMTDARQSSHAGN
jgi:hypothetical protein